MTNERLKQAHIAFRSIDRARLARFGVARMAYLTPASLMMSPEELAKPCEVHVFVFHAIHDNYDDLTWVYCEGQIVGILD